MTEKPGVVKTAIVILWIQIALLFIGGCAMFALTGEVEKQMGSGAGGLVTFTAFIFMIYAVIMTVLTLNLHSGKNWARITIVVLSILGAVSSLFTLSQSASPCGTIIGIGLAAVIAGCLLSSEAKQWCLDASEG
ncbi:MAG: hypothetical protein ACRD0P_17365 [Stackebrandtia sp.]